MSFWRRKSLSMSEDRVICAAEAMARTAPERQIEVLREAGFSDGEAHRFVALLPVAFSRPVLEELGVAHFVPDVTAVARDGSRVKAALMRQPEYAAGLALARKHRRVGVMDHEVYKTVTGSSADIDAASNAKNAGASLIGSTIATSLVGPDIAEHLIT